MKIPHQHFLTGVVMSLLLLSSTGCSLRPILLPTPYDDAAQNQFTPTNRAAAAALLAQVQDLSPSLPMIVATIVDINALDRSSTMGRLISEQISGMFSQAGYRMIEMKIRDNVYLVRNEGEFLLTREIEKIATQHRAQAVIVGTYAVGDQTVFVNVKIVQPGTNFIIAAHDYALPKNGNVRAMLAAPVIPNR